MNTVLSWKLTLGSFSLAPSCGFQSGMENPRLLAFMDHSQLFEASALTFCRHQVSREIKVEVEGKIELMRPGTFQKL